MHNGKQKELNIFQKNFYSTSREADYLARALD